LALLEVHNLKTYYMIRRGYVKAVDDVNFQVEKRESLGLAGESGCGKTTVAISILRILPSNARIMDGQTIFDGTDILNIPESEMREKIRWKGISLIFQGAMNALNPVYNVGNQISEAILTHEPEVSKDEALERAKKLFDLVGIEPSRINNYPHEFSGGMRQRAMIAMALACNPKLLIADEPATALDVIVQAQILKLFKDLKEKLNLSMILITHDLSIIAETCEKVSIMYAGKIVEQGDIVEIFKNPLHPYTQGLIGSFPEISSKEKMNMYSIPGSPPDLLTPPNGCRFWPRCKYAFEKCKLTEPEETNIGKNHWVACHMTEKA